LPPCGALDADQSKGEVEHGQEVVGPFFPANQQAAEAVDPAVGPLNWPAAGLLAGFGTPVFSLLAARPDMGIVLAAQDLPPEPKGIVASHDGVVCQAVIVVSSSSFGYPAV
jgi:hypothetical protein